MLPQTPMRIKAAATEPPLISLKHLVVADSPSDTALAFSKATWDEAKGQKATRRTMLWNLPRLSTHSSTLGEKRA